MKKHSWNQDSRKGKKHKNYSRQNKGTNTLLDPSDLPYFSGPNLAPSPLDDDGGPEKAYEDYDGSMVNSI